MAAGSCAERTREREARFDRVAAQLLTDRVHRLIEVDGDHLATEAVVEHLRQVLGGVGLELLEPHAVGIDAPEGLAVSGARDADPHRARRAVARQPDHAHVVAKVLPAELGSDAHALRELVDARLHLDVAEGAAVLVTRCGQRIVVPRRAVLDRLQALLRR